MREIRLFVGNLPDRDLLYRSASAFVTTFRSLPLVVGARSLCRFSYAPRSTPTFVRAVSEARIAAIDVVLAGRSDSRRCLAAPTPPAPPTARRVGIHRSGRNHIECGRRPCATQRLGWKTYGCDEPVGGSRNDLYVDIEEPTVDSSVKGSAGVDQTARTVHCARDRSNFESGVYVPRERKSST
jgi:hypothetical protein